MRGPLAALLAVIAAGALAGQASADAQRVRLAVPPGYIARATLVLHVTRATRSDLVVRDNRRRRVAFRRGPLRRGQTLRLDVTRAVGGSSSTVVLRLSSAVAQRPRLETDQTATETPTVPFVPAGEPEPVSPAAPAADPDPVTVTPPPPPPAPATPDARQQATIDLLRDAAAADGHRYAAIDDRALSLDGLKIIESTPGAYVGIYHSLDAGMFRLKVATSRDLLNWHWRTDLDTGAAQGAIAKAGDGSYVIAYEKSSPGQVQLRFRGYDSLEKLLAGDSSREFTAPLTLAPTAEGTPDIESVDQHTIAVGFHYYRDALVDRQARGVLTDFSSWSAQTAPDVDALFTPFGVRGNIGDRDWFQLGGHDYALHEAQTTKDDWSSWRTYLVDRDTRQAFALDTRTAGGSHAFGNPTATIVTGPSGDPAIVVTQFVFSEAAARGEAGSLIYFKALPVPLY